MKVSTDNLLAERGLTRDPYQLRQFSEIALVVANGCGLVLTLALWILLGWVASGSGGSRIVYLLGTGGLAFFLTGLAIHGCRYYAALIRGTRHGSARPPTAQPSRASWLTQSSDKDFVVQAVIGAAAVVIGLV
jgi:hypothetical protein